MKKSINYWTLGGFDGAVPVAEAARKARDMGFDGIELCYGAGELTPMAGEAELERLRAAVAATGIQISSLASGEYWRISLSSPDTEEREQAISFTRAYLRAAAALGVDAVLVVPGAVAVPWDDARPIVPARQVWDLAADSLASLIPDAEASGVTLAIENVWNRFLTGPFEFASFLDGFQSSRVKAYFDVGNVLLFGHPEHWIDILGDRIARVHVKNFARRDGAGTLGDFTGSLHVGSMDWNAVLEALRQVGYDGWLTAEMLVSEDGIPSDGLARRTAREMRELLGL